MDRRFRLSRGNKCCMDKTGKICSCDWDLCHRKAGKPPQKPGKKNPQSYSHCFRASTILYALLYDISFSKGTVQNDVAY